MAEDTRFERALLLQVGWISNPLRYHYSNPPNCETVILPSTSIITVSGGWIFFISMLRRTWNPNVDWAITHPWSRVGFEPTFPLNEGGVLSVELATWALRLSLKSSHMNDILSVVSASRLLRTCHLPGRLI